MTIGRTLEFYSVNFPSDIRGRKRNKIVIRIIILSVISVCMLFVFYIKVCRIQIKWRTMK